MPFSAQDIQDAGKIGLDFYLAEKPVDQIALERPILKALQAAAETLSNEAMKQDALDLLDQVREGAPLGAALSAKKRFPGLLAMFTRLGEQTGELPQMLDRAARQLSTEVTRRAMQIATLLEPLLIITMGGIVLTIVLSVLLPIMNMQKLL